MSTHANLIPNTLINWHFQSFSPQDKRTLQLYKNFNLSAEKLSQPGALLEASQYAQLVNKSTSLFNDESFTLLNQPLRCGTFKLMTQACISCQTLESALQRMVEFYHIVSTELDWHVEQENNQVALYFNLCEPTNSKANYFIAFMMSSVWRWLCWLLAQPINLKEVEFSFSNSDINDELAKVFNSPIKLNKNNNKLCFDVSYLPQKVRQTPESLILFLKQAPENLFSHYKTNLSLKNQVREHLEAQPKIQQITIADVAKTFFLSEQTLMRKLKKEKSSFKKIKNSISQNQAKKHLVKTRKTINEIAYNIGFIDVSAFYKNFKRANGITPSQYRKNLNNEN